MRFVALFAVLAGLALAQPRTEIGSINGAQYRIDVPEKWNGSLVLYCHGYSPVPGQFKEGPPNALAKEFLDRGYALAQSGYSAGGWAIQEALTDTESLRRHFVSKYGAPKETWITGHSMGGFLTMAFMEMHPATFDGGLPLCGPLASPSTFMTKQLEMFAVVNHYFPGLLPKIGETGGVLDNRAWAEKIGKAFAAAPEKAAIVRKVGGFKADRDAAGVIAFGVLFQAELFKRAGGNPFDNRSVIYTGTPDDAAINDTTPRYSADPKAAAYLRSYYSPTGRIEKPMLAIHTVYDPLVPAWVPNNYPSLATAAGRGDLFVQQYVKRDGHCTISPAETGRGFDELRAWAKDGKRASAGDRTIGPTAASSN